MKTIAILMFDHTPLSSLAAPIDIFNSAGVLWDLISGHPPQRLFKVRTVTEDGRPVKSLNGMLLTPDGAVEDAGGSDLIVIPSLEGFSIQGEEFKTIIRWLIKQHSEGTHIASICTGAFLLAETGLLDGKTATTHWGAASEFRNRYPDVRLEPQRLITDEGDLFCSGGANAGADLSLYLINKYFGHEIASQTAKALVIDLIRESQAPYAIFNFEKSHGDEKIVGIQEWIAENYPNRLQTDILAKKLGLTRRTFERRFKKATGETPLHYLQRVRVEKAKQLLEKDMDTFDEITFAVGYEDSSSFRKMFIHHTGLCPSSYRRKFRRI